ncbi:MAG: anhydro-N-acetylmuramic acid kinase [Pseudomonadota bacterium]
MEPLRAVGTMSGTSLDGVDAAEIWTDGETIHRFGRTAYRDYSDGQRAVLRAALGLWQGEPGVAQAAQVVEDAHLDLLRGFPEAVLVAFHGQTLAHDPAGGRTHQAGDGARLAKELGRRVVWDFRSADVALGGEGAPLAPAFHHACARWIGAEAPVAFLNLGGVGNLTWVDPAKADMAEEGALLAFDTGPANAPINDLCQRVLGKPYDRDGRLALEGIADGALVAEVMQHRYFFRLPPKSLDRDDFAEVGAGIGALRLADAVATWVAVIAASVDHALDQCPTRPTALLVTGGGRRNAAIMAALRAIHPAAAPVETVGLNGDMLEAQAFAYLAVRVRRGLATSFPGTTGVAAAVGGGQVSDPPGAVDSVPGHARHQSRRRLTGLR